MMKVRVGRNARRQRGQSLVEFALVVPVMAIMLCSVLEFGFAFDGNMAIEAASREGARIGASLGNDGTQGVCPNALAESTVDPGIINAVQTSLVSSGINMTTVQVQIFGADASGNAATAVNTYKWSGTALTKQSGTYLACSRHDGTFGGGTYDDIAVRITYTYTSKTGLLAIFTGGLPMTVETVMPIGPPWKLQ